ncbi:MAG: FAD:protein FMN transferase [Actinomycetota bacterium]
MSTVLAGGTSTLPRRMASADGVALGTQVRVVVTDARALGVACSLLDAELSRIDKACSRFRKDSELVALDGADGVPQEISGLLAEAIEVALRAARVTGGQVDLTVGQAMNDAGYDRDFAAVARTGRAIRVVRRPVPGWQLVQLDLESRRLTIPSGTRLDLGATAKALAADRAASQIAESTGVGVLVSLGGDIAVGGVAPSGGWPVRVQDIAGHPDATVETSNTQGISLTSGGLATSSTAARKWTRGGRLMHHILDPLSGLPVTSPWRTVSVAAASCVDANIASTASIVRGIDAPGWLQRGGLDARLVTDGGSIVTVGRWPGGEN